MTESRTEKSKLFMKNHYPKTQENITLVHTDLISDRQRSRKWTHVSIMCLLEILYEEFDGSKLTSPISQREIFERASTEMKKNGFYFSKEELKLKYKNLITQYRNVKAKSYDTENKNCSWPYFEIVSEVYRKEKRYPRNFKSLRRIDFKKSPADVKKLNSAKNVARSSLARSNLTPKSEGSFISTANDLTAFTTHWEAKQFSNEDQKLKLLENLFEDLNAQRADVEDDALIHVKMRSEKLKYLKQIITEMNEFRINLKNEFSSLVELINDVIVALRDSSGDKNS